MSSPMYDVPDHFYMPFDAAGRGPAEDEDTVFWGCWCGDGPSCTVLPPRQSAPAYGYWGSTEG